MIALQGRSGPEDTVLNIGGMLAMVVAVIPTGRGADFQTAAQACEKPTGALLTNRGAPGLDCPTVQPLQDAGGANVENNAAALLIAGGLALILSAVILFGDGTVAKAAPRGADGRSADSSRSWYGCAGWPP